MTGTLAHSLRRSVAIVAAAATAAVLGVAGSPAASQAADGPAPLIHYTFDDAPAGAVVSDASGNGNDATIRQTGARVDAGVLSLPGGSAGSAGYLQIPTGAIAGKRQLTVSTWLSPRSGAGNVAAAFIGAPVASGANYSSGYWLLNPSNPSGYVKSVITNSVSASPWSTEVGPGSTSAATSGLRTPAGMSLYTTVIDGVAGQLSVYVNGTRIGQQAISRDVSSFGANLVSYLGRSTYNDPGWAGDVDDFAVYGEALSGTQVQQIFAGDALQRAVDSVTVPGTATSAFTLPTSDYGASIAWASDSPAIAIAGGAATVFRPAAGSADASVTLTATFSAAGSTAIRTFVVAVPAELSDQAKADADAAAVQLAGIDDVRTNFSVPTSGANGSTLTWAITAGADIARIVPGVKNGSATVEVDRPGGDSAQVVLSLTATKGAAKAMRTFTAKVQPKPGASADPEAYVWAFFTGEGAGAEKVSLAASKGNDALRWNTLNAGEPIFTSHLGTQGLRDPFIIRSHEGDRFFMLATDLKIDGLPGGFTTAQISGSRAIEVWESNDLVNWSEQRHIEVSSPLAGNTWAPEAYWDDEIGRYVVFWASNLYDTADVSARKGVTYNRMIYVTTDDFVTFSEPQVWSDVPRGAGKGLIDSTVAKVDDTYYRFTKDEASMTLRAEKSTNLLAKITGTLPGSSGAADEWTLIKEKVASGLPNGEPGGTYSSGEGPSIFPSNPGDVNGYEWYLFIDQPSYHGGPNHYIPFGSQNIADGSSWEPLGATLRANLPQNSDGGKPRHGTVIPVTRAEYQKVLEAYAPSIAVKKVGDIAVSTPAGTAPVLPKATLTTAAGDESIVDVAWAGIDAADFANPGTFTVRGVAQDASRMPVTATVTVTAGVSVRAATRCVAGKATAVATVQNGSTTDASATVASEYGSRAVTLAAGATQSVAFSSRLTNLPAGSVSVKTADGGTVSAEYAALRCG